MGALQVFRAARVASWRRVVPWRPGEHRAEVAERRAAEPAGPALVRRMRPWVLVAERARAACLVVVAVRRGRLAAEGSPLQVAAVGGRSTRVLTGQSTPELARAARSVREAC